jgi:hypothetical protein
MTKTKKPAPKAKKTVAKQAPKAKPLAKAASSSKGASSKASSKAAAAPKKTAASKTASKAAAATKAAAAPKAAASAAASKAATASKATAAPKKAAASAAAPKATTPKVAASAAATKKAAASAAVSKAAAPAAPAAAVDEAGLGWIDAGKGYALTLDGGKLAARNDKGKRLSSVPKELKDGDVADGLEALRDWLAEHERECRETVDLWMLRSLAVPRAVLQAVWEDAAWRRPLENAVVVAVDADGGHDHARSGLFRGVDPKRGIGVVDLDGETVWFDTERVAIPHPILIPELDAWRDLVGQLGVAQGLAQLHRETHVKSAEQASSQAQTIDQFEDGKFAMLMHAVGKARQLGYKVRGGFATCKVWDAGSVNEARYWIGAESPDAETYTGLLSWVDSRERGLPLAKVGPVAFSEGMRMASSIFAARVVEKKEDA